MNPDQLVAEVQSLLALDSTMPDLVPTSSPASDAKQLIATTDAPDVILTGLWLYVDDLDRSHTISQGIQSPIGSWWHAIMHRREGDFWNSKYWYRQVGRDALAMIDGFDPFEFVDSVERDGGQNSPELVALQRSEWQFLMAHCLRNQA